MAILTVVLGLVVLVFVTVAIFRLRDKALTQMMGPRVVDPDSAEPQSKSREIDVNDPWEVDVQGTPPQISLLRKSSREREWDWYRDSAARDYRGATAYPHDEESLESSLDAAVAVCDARNQELIEAQILAIKAEQLMKDKLAKGTEGPQESST